MTKKEVIKAVKQVKRMFANLESALEDAIRDKDHLSSAVDSLPEDEDDIDDDEDDEDDEDEDEEDESEDKGVGE